MEQDVFYVQSASYLSDYRIRVTFIDQSVKDVDLADEIEDGTAFEALRDPDFFRQFVAHPEAGTLVWPNGVDIAPEFLYETGQAVLLPPKRV